MGAGLRLDTIQVAYRSAGGVATPVRGLSLELAAGEIGCLLGPSGCGKTTVLRAIAGFEPLRAGTVVLGDVLLSSGDTHVPPERRRVGMVFQDFALFPHLTVAANVCFGLRRLGADAQRARCAELLALVGMPDLGARWPHELSGGQQQRVALARALAPSPALLLLDEPFSSLDVGTRARLSTEVRAILRDAGQTALLVTHHEAEATAMADRLGHMADGALADWSAP